MCEETEAIRVVKEMYVRETRAGASFQFFFLVCKLLGRPIFTFHRAVLKKLPIINMSIKKSKYFKINRYSYMI